MRKDESAARLFGRPLAEGERFVQAELARTLRAIAAGGRDAFYTGEIAEDIVGHLRSKGGLHTLDDFAAQRAERSEEHTSELQSLMRISYAVFCLKKKIKTKSRYTVNKH